MSDRDKLVEELLVGLAPLKFRIPTHAEALVRQAAQQIRKDGEEIAKLRAELATRDRLKAALEKAADTFDDAKTTFALLRHLSAAEAMKIAGEETRQALQPTEDKPKDCPVCEGRGKCENVGIEDKHGFHGAECSECWGSGRIYYETGEFAGDQPITDWEPCPNKCNPIGEGGE